MSEIAEQRSFFIILLNFFLNVGTQVWSQLVTPVGTGGVEVGGNDGPWLVCQMEGLLVSFFLFFFECFPQVGWAQNTFNFFFTTLLFPQLLCLSSAERSQQKCGWRRKTERNIVQGLAVWAVQRSCAMNDKSERRNTPQISWE